MFLIGSQALKIVAPELLDREPADWDLIGTQEDLVDLHKRVKFEKMVPTSDGNKILCFKKGMLPVEFELIWPGSSNEMLFKIYDNWYNSDEEELLYQHREIIEFGSLFFVVPPIETLFAIKSSHRFRKNTTHFIKNRKDYLNMKESVGELPDYLKEFHKLREQETYTYKHPKLSTSKDKFFNPEEVEYLYDHDSIHRAIAHPLEPAYKSFQTEQVFCSREMFEKLPLKEQLRSVYEESCVLALERSQIPHPGILTPRESFLIALEKVCTSIASGWWREFAYLNFDNVLMSYSETFGHDHYMLKFSKGVESGIVKKVKDMVSS